MKIKWMLALLLTFGLVISLNPIGVSAQAAKEQKADCITPQMVQLKTDMQRAWIDHTVWTRSYIVSALSDLKDQQDVLDRILRNQQDTGNLIKPYYGEAAGNKLADLLKEHIVLAGKIVGAAKANKQDEVKKLEADWHKNADDIATFLSSANPNWSFKALQDMLYTHLQYVTDIVLSYIKGDWKANIAVTDQNETHMIHLADMLTEGIIKQFPNKF